MHGPLVLGGAGDVGLPERQLVRQTVADIEQGRTWPVVETAARVLAPLGSKVTPARAF